MEKIFVNGIELAYERYGEGTPLVLLHGYPLDHHIWDAVVPLLRDKFKIILPDLRGFGNSITSNEPYSMDDFASDIANLLDHLHIDKTAIAGHSMGGYVALAFARLFPQRVNGLGLIASQVLADSAERKDGRYKSATDIVANGIQSVVDTMTPKFTSNKAIQTNARKIMQRQQPAAYIGALKAMAERSDSSNLLPTFTFPVVVLHGDDDELIPIDRAREVKNVVTHAHLTELKGIGHLPMMESPKETAKALSVFE